MKAIINALWNYPTVFAGALQAVNALLAAEGVLPTWASISLASVVAVANFAAVSPAHPKS
jgi:uncharacterized membrane protein YphA (DoxX/SURF4 family)